MKLVCWVIATGIPDFAAFIFIHELRPDIFPVDDIGLHKAVALHYHDGERLPAAALRSFGDRWSPYRSVATWYLWRSLDPIPVEY